MLISILIFIIVLSVIVLVHEFGHFITAKRNGVRVEEFALGFPPKIWSKKLGETIYSINALPLGGFVRLYGEDNDPKTDKNRSFFHKTPRARLVVAVAGAFMNLVLGIVLFSAIYMKLGVPSAVSSFVTVILVDESSPAANANLKPFDRILEVGNTKISSIENLQKEIDKNKDQETVLKVERSKLVFLADSAVITGNIEELSLTVVPKHNPTLNRGTIGIAPNEMLIGTTTRHPWYEMPYRAGSRGIGDSLGFAQKIAVGIIEMFQKLIFHREVPTDVAGPVGIYKATEEVSKLGVYSLLAWMGILSINLALLNVLPFPGLDGGRAVFIIAEMVTRRRVGAELERKIHFAGIVILMGLVLLITVQDVGRLFGV